MSKTPKHIVEKIRKARAKGKTELPLSHQNLSEIPEEIFEQDSFEDIWLLDNQIRSVPARIAQLKKLRRLVLFGNPLEEIADVPGLGLDFSIYQKFKKQLSPAHLAGVKLVKDEIIILEELENFPQLTLINLSNNKLSQLPEAIAKLQNIISLDLSKNQFFQLPKAIAKLQKLTEFKLSKNQFSQLPEAITELQNLTDLDLSENKFSQLPDTIAKLQKLTELNLSKNQFFQLPEAIAKLQNLTELDLSKNKFSQLPDTIAKLQKLTELNLNNNQLSELPEAIGKLQNLKSLDLSGNQFSQLPEAITKLQKLTSLDLSFNKFSQLPEAIAKLQNLTSLSLWNNQLSQLPEAIAKLQNLTSLDLGGNKFSQLPEAIAKLQNLTKLDLERNKIQSLPKFIIEFKNLQSLHFEEKHEYHSAGLVLSENPIQYPPKEVVAAGMEAVRSFFNQQAEQGIEKLFEAKLILVGEPGAGKTSLMHKLLDENYPIPNSADKSTVGITVKTGWQFPYVKDHARRFAANFWDFGGQDIQFMTHQFFLTSRALYVLLVDDRKQHTQFDYWFNIIKLLGAGSPVLVVLNERDCCSITNFDYDSFRKFYENNFTIKKLDVDLGEANLNRFRVLRDQIQTMLCELPHIGAELPAQWIPIRQELEKRRLENHIPLEEYSRICTAHRISKLEDQLVLSRYLHDLGIILHFQEDPQLAETVFLNPQWVVQAVYAILESDHAQKHKGRFSRKWMFGLWQEKGHSFAECNKLLNLMLKYNFELCYPIDSGGGEEYIAPQLLPGIRPAYPWPEKDHLHFRYQYQFMPKGIITRLIVRLNHLIARHNGEDLVWEKGVVLNWQGVAAQVTEEITKHEGLKVINMVLAGPAYGQKEFLSRLRAEVRSIHEKSFKGINVKEMVPIPWQPDAAVSYPHLLRLEAMGEREYIVEGVEQPVSVTKLLNGIELPNERRKFLEEFPEGIHVHNKIEVVQNNPQTVTQSNANQATATSQNEFNFTMHLNDLQRGLNELREEVEELEPEAAQEIAAIQQKLEKLEQTPKPEEVKKAGVMNKMKRFFDEANDTGTTLGKTVGKIKGGYKILQDLAGQYNKIAQWCGLPQVPSVFVKKE
jgi:Leucine-rich repeat (LRR) protein/GTPase SAR1 family protein